MKNPWSKTKIKIFNGVLMKLFMSLRINFFAGSSHVNAAWTLSVETQAFLCVSLLNVLCPL